MLKTFAFTLDLERAEVLATKIVVAVADYNVIQLTITLTQDGGPFNLTGRTVFLLTKTGTTVVKTPCNNDDETGGILSVIMPTEATNKAGLFIAELAIVEGTQQRAIPNQFNYTVRTSLYNDLATDAKNEMQAYHESTFERMGGQP
jgi:hypothetical protein